MTRVAGALLFLVVALSIALDSSLSDASATGRCAASGYVVTMEYQVDSSGEGADIDRQLWRTNGSMFRLVWSRHYRKTHRSFPEQRTSSPFGHCLTRS